MTKTVAIIGAGASGLPAIKSCLENDLKPVCFEKSNGIGGLWRYSEDIHSDRACVMRSTITNASKELTAFSDFPFPADFPNFMLHTKMLEYLQMYADKFDLLKHIRFQCEVIQVTRVRDENWLDNGWIIQYKDVKTGNEDCMKVDALMICSGNFSYPHVPRIPGHFKGELLHSRVYRSPEAYTDKQVVVVGLGNSACDIAVELSRVTDKVYLSTRRKGWILNRLYKNGVPVDLTMSSRFVWYLRPLLGNKIANMILRKQFNSKFDHSVYGLKPNHEPLSQHPVVNDELQNRIIAGTIAIKPDIRKFDEKKIVFDDGTLVDADAVIFATGYEKTFPFLEEGIIEGSGDNRFSLYKLMFPANSDINTLAVIGCVTPWGPVLPVVEMQSRYASYVIKGSLSIPTSYSRKAEVEERRKATSKRFINSARHLLEVEPIPYLDDLAERIGAKPDIGTFLFRDPRLFKALLFGPFVQYQYRLQGPDSWSGARETILTIWDRVYAPFGMKIINVASSRNLVKWSVFVAFLGVVIYLIIIYRSQEEPYQRYRY